MPKKIFITGGAGYVGCRLVPFLLDRVHGSSHEMEGKQI